MSKLQSWIKDQIGAWLIGLLIFSLVLAITGFVASFDARRKMNAFASDGHTVTGTITNKYVRTISITREFWLYVHSSSQKQENRLDLSFQGLDGKFHYESATVPNMIFDLSQVGSPIKVTYVKSNPDLFYVADDAPQDQDAAIFTDMFHYGTIASLLVLIGIATLVFWNPAGAAMDQTASNDLPGKAPFRPLRSQLPAGFGKRRL